MRHALVVMGIAGSGKTLIGSMLADALGIRFIEGDLFHSAENVAKMAAGTPLTDDDRQDWLQALSRQLAEARAAGQGAVVSCSALKRRYRDLLRSGDRSLRFIFLQGDRALLGERLATRSGHYMGAVMLDSQLATLEVPGADERAWTYDVRIAPDGIVRAVITRLRAESGEPDA